MAAKNFTWIGTGAVYLGDYDATNGIASSGFLINLKKIACAISSLTTTINVEKGEVKESCTTARSVIEEFEKTKGIDVSITMDQFSRDEIAQAIWATSTLQTAGSVTTPGETWPTLAVGDYVQTMHPQISTLVVKDSAGTPATLVLNTDYEIVNANQGLIKILNLGSYVQPFFADSYSYAEYGNLAALGQTTQEKGILFTGVNQNGDLARVTIPRVPLTQDGDFNWLSEEPAQLTMSGKALYVEGLDTAGSLFGPYMRVDNLAA